MFEDENQDNPQTPGNAAGSAPRGATSNRPTPPPPKNFGHTPPSRPIAPAPVPNRLQDSPTREATEPGQPVEDIFGDTEAPSAPRPPARTMPAGYEELEEKPKIVTPRLIIIILVVLLVLGLGAWAAYTFLIAPPSNENANTNESVNANLNTNQAANSNVNQPFPGPAPINQPADTDQDRLTDEEEFAIGTSPTNPDTDNDGLTDYEEARVYQTNPLDPDTDADGFRDGDEVRAGFDPRRGGGARLLDLQTGINNLSANTNQ